jgi:enoyl-CoA hydratase
MREERMAKVETRRDDDGVRVLTLNDPERRNAIGYELAEELSTGLDEIARDPNARALVVTGAGSAFCAGADFPAVFGDSDRQPVAAMRERLKSYYRCFLRLLELRIPSLAAVHGPAVGAGLNLALACDIRFAGPRASFAATFVRIGLHPGGGCSYFLTRTLGPQRPQRLLLEGGTLDAERAVANRLADELVDDPVAAAEALARQIASREPELVRDVKRAVRLADADGFEASLEFEAWAQAASTRNPAVRETVARLSGSGR